MIHSVIIELHTQTHQKYKVVSESKKSAYATLASLAQCSIGKSKTASKWVLKYLRLYTKISQSLDMHKAIRVGLSHDASSYSGEEHKV